MQKGPRGGPSCHPLPMIPVYLLEDGRKTSCATDDVFPKTTNICRFMEQPMPPNKNIVTYMDGSIHGVDVCN